MVRSAFLLLIFVSLSMKASAHEFYATVGPRVDHLRFPEREITATLTQLLIGGNLYVCQGLLLEGELGYGVVARGRGEGSQKPLQQRCKGSTFDLSLDVGWLCRTTSSNISLIPKIGLALGNLGYIRDFGWWGPWVGVESRIPLSQRAEIRAQVGLQGGLSNESSLFAGAEARISWEYVLTSSLRSSVGLRGSWRRSTIDDEWILGALVVGLRF